ncbi:MAG: calcium/sodium antiporter, partial [Gammaproteobacteria bacterium]|nr:calcium/sodium antiporter [Gammaproteobacteria bacterium]
SLARTLGVSPLIIGLIVVGWATSAPEMLVSAIAAMEGNTNLAVGNAIGSNITNIGLILGMTAMMLPLAVHSDLIRREFPILMAIMALVILLFLDGQFERIDGILLLGGLLCFLWWMIHLAQQQRMQKDPMTEEVTDELPQSLPLNKSILWLVIGLTGLLIGARLVVWGSVAIAQALGVSDLIIGLTIVAIGTSLPELAATVMSARKGEDDLAIGNIIGSNIFNLLAVLGIPAVIAPAALDVEVMTRDIPVMLLLTVLLYFMAKGQRGTGGKIGRVAGGSLLAIFLGYLGTIYYMASA